MVFRSPGVSTIAHAPAWEFDGTAIWLKQIAFHQVNIVFTGRVSLGKCRIAQRSRSNDLAG
jgi:hypothetical protein